jgi:hypothetical protein
MLELFIGIIALIILFIICKISWYVTPHADVPSCFTWVNKKEDIQVEFMFPEGVHYMSAAGSAFIRDCVKDANTKLGLSLKAEDFSKSSTLLLFRGKYLIDGIIDYTRSEWRVNSNHYMMRSIMSFEEVSNYKG